MAAGCMSVNAVAAGQKIDVQVNSVVNALSAGQYIYDPNYPVAPFSSANPARSMVTIEIDHINEQAEGENEQLVCLTAVVLVASIYGEWQGQNCWSKMHGSSNKQTGWAEGVYPSDVVSVARDVVEAFAMSRISAEQMVYELRAAFHNSMLEHKTGDAQHLHAGET